MVVGACIGIRVVSIAAMSRQCMGFVTGKAQPGMLMMVMGFMVKISKGVQHRPGADGKHKQCAQNERAGEPLPKPPKHRLYAHHNKAGQRYRWPAAHVKSVSLPLPLTSARAVDVSSR